VIVPAAEQRSRGRVVERSAVTTKRKVVILNDDPDLVEMMTSILIDAGYDVAASVVRDLGFVIAELPDLVLLDCPPGEEKQILGFAQQMRLTRSIAHVPILLATSSFRHLEPALLRDKLILDLLRPYGADELLQTVETLLHESFHRQQPT
jgi:DNA-binding response OmpR family regulator